MNASNPLLIAGLLVGTSLLACQSTPAPSDDLQLRTVPAGSPGGVLVLSLAWQGVEPGPTGTPWRPTTVTLIDPYDPSAVFSTMSDPELGPGAIDLTHIPPGSYRVAVHSPGYLPQVSTAVYQVEPDVELLVDLTAPGSVLGDVLCANENMCEMRAGDLDRSGEVDEYDAMLMEAPGSAGVDFNLDGQVDGQDAALVWENLGTVVPPLGQIFAVPVPKGLCALPSAGLGEPYPECLTIEWEPELVDCDLLCSEQIEPFCTDVCGEGLTCADVLCPACDYCSGAFLECRQSCRSVHPFG